MSNADRSRYFCQNPITGVQMFQHEVNAFFFENLSDPHPVGHMTDCVIKIEFQMRESPHAHCFLWVNDAPKIDKDPDDIVCSFIDKYITAVIPPVAPENEHDIKLMENLQNHTHSDYCCRNKSCHVGFHKPPATSYYLKSDILRWYNFKRFELCDPKNRRHKHSLDIKGNIKGHMWFVSMGAVIENLINLNISTSYFLVTHIVVLLSLDWKYTGKLDKIFSRDFEIWILILLKIYITQKTRWQNSRWLTL